MYKLFITQLSHTQLMFNKLSHFVIKMFARFQCLQKIVLKKVQNKNSIPTAKMPPPKKKDKTKSKKQITTFLNNVLQYVYLQYWSLTDSLKNAFIIKH